MKTKVGIEAADDNVFIRNKATDDNTNIDVAIEDIVDGLEDNKVGNNYVTVGGNDNDDGSGGGISDIHILIVKWWSLHTSRKRFDGWSAGWMGTLY